MDINALLKMPEGRKIDFKQTSYDLSDNQKKSEFIKDVISIANTSGEDGYIITGIKLYPNGRKKLFGVTHHPESANLIELISSKINEPIELTYLPVRFKRLYLGIIRIPPSKLKPHYSIKDFGILKRKIIYTRHGSRNSEATDSEIREMYSQKKQSKPMVYIPTQDLYKHLDVGFRSKKILGDMYKKRKAIKYTNLQLINYSDKDDSSACVIGRIRRYPVLFMFWGDGFSANDQRTAKYVIRNLKHKLEEKLTKNNRIILNILKSLPVLIHVTYGKIYTKGINNMYTMYTNIRNLSSFPWGDVLRIKTSFSESYEFNIYINVKNEDEIITKINRSYEYLSNLPIFLKIDKNPSLENGMRIDKN